MHGTDPRGPERMHLRPKRAPLAGAVLSSAFAAAWLNLGTSTLDHPRALASWPALGPPFVAGFGLFCALAWALLAGTRLFVRRSDSTPLELGLLTGFLLCAALHPLVEAALREATSQRAAVLLASALGFATFAAVAVHARASRTGADLRVERMMAVMPLFALVASTALWLYAFHVEGLVGRALLALGALAAAASGVRLTDALAPRRVLGVLAALALIQLAWGSINGEGRSSAPSSAAGDFPPLVLITVDTLRADRVLGDARPERVPTPAIDALAADSVVFTAARAPAPWTKPSLATLLTGLSPLVHGMTNRRARLPDEVETLAERLRTAGYRTAGFGLNAHLERAFRFDQGFDDYGFPARLDYGVALGARVLERLWPARFPELFPSTRAIADVALDWLAAQDQGPFFLWLHVLDPHWPYEPPAEWLEQPEREPRRWGEPAMVTNVQAGNTKPAPSERKRVQELYAGEIRYVDHELARILALLRARGLYERALIVFASDHGEEFWEHGRYEHGHTLYDEVLRVPLFFKLPGSGPRLHVDAPVSTEALCATVLDTLGIPFDPTRLSSSSLAPWWRDPSRGASAPHFATGTYYFGEKRGVLFDGLKLVVELDTGRMELYDLEADPRELVSLAAAEPGPLQRGLGLLEAWEQGCATLRERLGITSSAATADPETLRMLEGLGYLGAD
jgi:arylsulfatase A-like enzyme